MGEKLQLEVEHKIAGKVGTDNVRSCVSNGFNIIRAMGEEGKERNGWTLGRMFSLLVCILCVCVCLNFRAAH